MQKWYGSAGLCLNEQKEMLMVLQGKTHEEKKWAIPAGGKEGDETFEECCIREVQEETGFEVKITRPLFIKEGTTYGVDVEVHYFEVQVTGGSPTIQDPDNLIHDIAWKSQNELLDLPLAFPEDKDYLLQFMTK
jgi:ADP-ribose pyrophosphatase YjhB (NUDIX family)